METQVNKDTKVKTTEYFTFIEQNITRITLQNTDLFKMCKAFAKATLRYKLRQVSEFLTDLSNGCPQETKW